MAPVTSASVQAGTKGNTPFSSNIAFTVKLGQQRTIQLLHIPPAVTPSQSALVRATGWNVPTTGNTLREVWDGTRLLRTDILPLWHIWGTQSWTEKGQRSYSKCRWVDKVDTFLTHLGTLRLPDCTSVLCVAPEPFVKGPPDCREEIKCGKSFEMWVVIPALTDFGGILSHFFKLLVPCVLISSVCLVPFLPCKAQMWSHCADCSDRYRARLKKKKHYFITGYWFWH